MKILIMINPSSVPLTLSCDLVYRNNLAFRKEQCKKTEFPWVGSLLVIERLSPVTYRVRRLSSHGLVLY